MTKEYSAIKIVNELDLMTSKNKIDLKDEIVKKYPKLLDKEKNNFTIVFFDKDTKLKNAWMSCPISNGISVSANIAKHLFDLVDSRIIKKELKDFGTVDICRIRKVENSVKKTKNNNFYAPLPHHHQTSPCIRRHDYRKRHERANGITRAQYRNQRAVI